MELVKLNPSTFKTLKKIGTPRGNEGFFSELYGIPIKQFYHKTAMDNLVKLLKKGRIDVILFERASTMTSIQTHGYQNIFYRKMDTLPASFAVRKNKKGIKLKKKLEALFQKIDQDQIFRKYLSYVNMPDSGLVPNK